MGAANRSLRRLLVGRVAAFSFFATCGAVSGSLDASPVPSLTFPAERDRADLSLDASLWRSIFHRADGKENWDEASGGSVTPLQASHPDAVFSGLTAAEDFFENESLFSVDSASLNRSVQSSATQTMTDWQNAVCNADGVQGKKTTAQGPSAVTAVVAVVGAVVVFGAYFKSSGR